MSIPNAPVPPPSPAGPATSFWTWAALLTALAGVAGTLWLSLGMNLIACPLCFYQRPLMMGVAGIMLAGIFGGSRRAGLVSLMALPVTVAGLGVAGFHVYKEFNGDLECPTGALCQLYAKAQGAANCPAEMSEYDTAPRESLAVFALIFLLQTIDVLRSGSRGGFGMSAWLGVVILGGLISYGLIASIQDPCTISKDPLKPINGCRKPVQPPVQPAGGPGGDND
jgi:disulfide bond formation protein DsbB